MNVLIVEDDADQRELLSIYLRRAGCTVFPTGRAEDAVVTVERVRLDLAIIDAHLPGDSTATVTALLRSTRPGCPVVLTSVLDRDAFPITSDFLSKPFTRADVLRLIPQQAQSFIPQPRSGEDR